jgi:predicted house-cleaning noncanonical NTP pyrophosphatase (MazG superfamily)
VKIYNKLVRDKIPKVIKKEGKTSKTRILNEDEYNKELFKKLIEEAVELSQARNDQEIIEELADIYEVIETILFNKNIDIREIQKQRIKKNIAKGTFEERIFLEYVED